MRPGGILCGHDFYKTAAYTRSVLASVPRDKVLDVGGLVAPGGGVGLDRLDISGWCQDVSNQNHTDLLKSTPLGKDNFPVQLKEYLGF